MLTLLKQERFRQDIKHMDMAQMIMDDMFAKWLGMGRYKPPDPAPSIQSTENAEELRQSPDGGKAEAEQTATAANGHGNGDAMDGVQMNGAIKMEN